MTKLNYQQKSINYTQSGFSLIEVMIAALILSIGILGVAGLQIVGLKGTHQSFMKQQAADLVNNITERMRSNKDGLITDKYLLTGVNDTKVDCTTNAPNCSTTNCSSENVALLDLHNMVCGFKAGASSNFTGGVKRTNADDNAIFVDGNLSISCPNGCNTGDVQILVQWSESDIKEVTEPKVLDSLVVNTRILP